MDGVDAGLRRVIDLQDRRIYLQGAEMESHLHLRCEVQRRNRDLDRLALPAGQLCRLAEDVGIVHRPENRVILSAQHLIDLGVQLPRNLLAVSCEKMLPFCRRNVIAVQNAVGILCELATQVGALGILGHESEDHFRSLLQ